jgi:hypothetical protein
MLTDSSFSMKRQFSLISATVQKASSKEFQKYNQVMGYMAQMVTISKDEATEFPFVRVPKFEMLGRHARDAISTNTVIWAPFVTERQLTEWSNFSTAEQGWYRESLSILKRDPVVDEHRFANGSKLRDYIWERNELSDGETAVTSRGPFAPLWQISPPPSSLTSINYDLMQEKYIKVLMPILVKTRDYVMSSAKIPSNDLSGSDFVSKELNLEEKIDHPYSTHLTPVSDRLNDVNSPLAGFLLSTISWTDFLSRLFRQDEHDMSLVLRNTCNQAFTYNVQRGKVRGNFPNVFVFYFYVVYTNSNKIAPPSS